MSLKAIYQRFLDNPNPISLSDNASLHYVTTLTSYTEPAGIIRHLETHGKKIVKTKSTRVISAVEGHDALAIEVETVLEFISGGGAYLPGLENYVVDKIATIPTVSHAARPEILKRLTMRADTFHPIHCRPQDLGHSYFLGPGVTTQANRCDRFTGEKLATSGWSRSDPAHKVQRPGSIRKHAR